MTQSQPVWPFDRPAYESLAAAVQGEMARFNVPGLAVGILQGTDIDVATAGFGNLSARLPVRDHTIFQIGSITKVFTATLAMILVQEGLLDLDTPVKTYLPDLELSDAEATGQVTMRHLLSHTSGIEGDRFLDYGLGDDALEKSISEYNTLQQWYAPGEMFAYSNTSLSLAGRVIEVLAGTSYEQAMHQKLLSRLRMPDTALFTHEAIVRDAALGYITRDRADGYELATPYAFSRQITPAGNIVSSVSDLLRFARFHMNDGENILRADLARSMRVPTPLLDGSDGVFGIGWSVTRIAGTTMVAHNGSTGGQQALLCVWPERGYAIAGLSNSNKGLEALGSIVEWANERYRGIVIPKPEAIDLPVSDMEQWSGTWERHDRRLEFSVVDGIFTAEVTNLDPLDVKLSGKMESISLEPLAENKFRATTGDMKGAVVEFIRLRPDARGQNRDLVRIGGRLAERRMS